MTLSRGRERLLRRVTTRRGREAEGVVVLEGSRSLETALDHGAEILFALRASGAASAPSTLFERLTDSGVEVVELSRETFESFAATETPQGLLGLAREPRLDLPTRPSTRRPQILVLDGVQEPGNVGALVRTAAAFGLERVFALDGTADPWSAKAVRASAGLSFALPLHCLTWEKAQGWLAAAAVPLLVADGRGEDVRSWLSKGNESGPWALLVGNEGAGPRSEALDLARARLAIPLGPGVESLNVASAAAILMWALGPGRGLPPAAKSSDMPRAGKRSGASPRGSS